MMSKGELIGAKMQYNSDSSEYSIDKLEIMIYYHFIEVN